LPEILGISLEEVARQVGVSTFAISEALDSKIRQQRPAVFLSSEDFEQVLRELRKIHPCKAINPLISVCYRGALPKSRNCNDADYSQLCGNPIEGWGVRPDPVAC
jgi:hypothetical protein